MPIRFRFRDSRTCCDLKRHWWKRRRTALRSRSRLRRILTRCSPTSPRAGSPVLPRIARRPLLKSVSIPRRLFEYLKNGWRRYPDKHFDAVMDAHSVQAHVTAFQQAHAVVRRARQKNVAHLVIFYRCRNLLVRAVFQPAHAVVRRARQKNVAHQQVAAAVEDHQVRPLSGAFRAGPLTFRVGGLPLVENAPLAMDLRPISQLEGIEIAGILGYSMLSKSPFTIDLRTGIVEFARLASH